MLYFYITSVILTFLLMFAFKKQIKEMEFDDVTLAVLFVVLLIGFSYVAWFLIIVAFLVKPLGKVLQKYYIGD